MGRERLAEYKETYYTDKKFKSLSENINVDCAFFDNSVKGKCVALNKLYCKYEKCNFYKEHDIYKEIPKIVSDGKVYRLKF